MNVTQTFVTLLKKDFLCGAEEFLCLPSIFMLRFGEIRNEKYARLSGLLNIDELRRNRCKMALIPYRESVMLYNDI
jgi:hypothetical protein